MKLDLLLNRLQSIRGSKIDDSVDRLHYMWTSFALVFFCLVVGMQQTFNEPLVCMPQANFPAAWVKYVNHLCYIGGTFHTKTGQDFEHEYPKINIEYYQWIPYTLALQALLFTLPHLLYLVLAGCVLSGFNFKQVVDRCHGASSKTTEKLDEEVKDIAWSIYDFTRLSGSKTLLKPLGKLLVASYLLGKVLNLAVILANIYFLNNFIGMGNSSWAFMIIQQTLDGKNWESSGYFPRTTFCDVKIKMLGQPQKKTVQCLLMLNILTEKIYIILYFWLLFLAAITIGNLIWVSYNLFVKRKSELKTFAKLYFVKEELQLGDFLNNYMSLNGVLLVRFVKEHAGSRVAAKLVHYLVEFWKQRPATKFLGKNELYLSIDTELPNAKKFTSFGPLQKQNKQEKMLFPVESV